MLSSEILNEAPRFISQVLLALKGLNCDVVNLELDHICYRTETLDDYQELKKQLSVLNKLLADNVHNGREISVFELSSPIVFQERYVKVFELPAPNKLKSYETGYEHVEFVVKDDLRKFVQDRPHLNFNLKNIDLKENPSVKLKLKIGSVKFHNLPLQEVV